MPCFQHFLFSVSDLLIKKRSQNRLNVASSTSCVRSFFSSFYFYLFFFLIKGLKKKDVQNARAR